MHSFWLFFLRKRQFSWMVIFSLLALGAYSLVTIPKENSPEIIVPIGIVTTIYPGAPAADMEQLVTNKLENGIDNVENVDKLTSTSHDNVSVINVEFNASANVDKSIQDLKNAIDRVKGDLPTDAKNPVVQQVSFTNQPIHVISVSSDLTPVEFTKLGEDLSNEFKSVSGVSDVKVGGTRTRQIQVNVKQEALSAYGLQITDVIATLAASNLTVPVGTVLTGGLEYSVRLESKVSNITDIENLPVQTKTGGSVYIRDLATVSDVVDKTYSISRVSVNGKPSESSMTLSIYKKSGSDVTKMSAAVNKKLAELKGPGGLLENSQVLVIFDQGAETLKSLNELVKTGFETVILVVICLLLTIGWRESLVAALSIPLSFVIAFIGLYASGNTINFISLFALILAVGILVDSGIVITEAIHTRMRKFGNADDAAVQAIKEYAWPLIGGTMTTVAVFAPLFFLSGIVGQFIKSIPFTIIFVLIASIFVALGMVPLIAIYLTKHSSSNRFEEMQEEYTHKAQAWYRKNLVKFLQSKFAQRIFLWTLFIAFIGALMLPVFGFLNVVFFPGDNSDFIYVEVETPQGTPVAKTDLVVRQVEEVLYQKKYVTSFSSTAGAGSAFTGGNNSGGKFGNITVDLNKDRKETSSQISSDLRAEFAKIPNAVIKITEKQTGPPTGAPVFIKFLGTNLEDLARVADKAQSILNTIPGTRDVDSSTKSNATEFVLTIDRDKANLAGVNIGSVAALLRSTVFGTTATTLTRDGVDTNIVVKIGNADNTIALSTLTEINLDTLRNLQVSTNKGDTILLGSILSDKLAPANSAIDHEGKKRIATVEAYVNTGVTSAEVLAKFKSHVKELNLPAGTVISYGGEAENVNKSFTEMGLALIVGLVLMLAILVLAFNSIRYSLYLLLAVPYSLIGVFTGLALTGLALSFTSLLGVIALAGVIINHAIILMDSLITHKASEGDKGTLLDQVADASVSRFRPIVLTTITTVIGMVPLSTISDFWSPLAFAIMFGLSFAMILTLILVPTLYYRNEYAKLHPRTTKVWYMRLLAWWWKHTF